MLVGEDPNRSFHRSETPYAGHMGRFAQTKNGHAPKVCVACGKPFEWRRKWARDWGNVKYCSDRCRKGSTQT
jgi:hypothetical protein